MVRKIVKIKEIPNIDLSERELETVKMIWDGFTTKEIAEKLNISHRTVEVYISNLYIKVNKAIQLRNNNFVCLCRTLLRVGLLK
jgi:DNA-binding NarL/FixJ family response regulator